MNNKSKRAKPPGVSKPTTPLKPHRVSATEKPSKLRPKAQAVKIKKRTKATEPPDPAEPAISFLFRYRDLVDETIPRHQEIIKKSKMAWWGWWKRPSEDGRMEYWQDLENQIRERGTVIIGLFDSGHDTVRLATVDDVKLPKSNEFGTFDQVELADREQKLVPEYYRKSPFSRAWMRMRKINAEEFNFFGKYSFDGPPKMNGFSEKDLKRFDGKVIVDPAELRLMDATIWRVRPRQTQDKSDERVLTVRTTITAPVSASPIAARGRFVLHITDPHFAKGAHRDHHVWKLPSETGTTEPSLSDAINLALTPEIKAQIGLVLVTGDLTFKASYDEFEEASYGLNALLGALGLGAEHLVVVPGNHDIKWTRENKYSDKAKVNVAPEAAMEGYRTFFKNLFYYPSHPLLCMGRRFVLPSGIVLDICALNSSSLEQGKKFLAGMGRIREQAFQSAAKELNWSTSDKPSSLRILAMHHHLVPTSDVEPHSEFDRGFGMAIDAPRIQRLATSFGVQLVIHGHRHNLFLWQSRVFEAPDEDHTTSHSGDISLLGGGTAGSPESNGKHNFFNLIEITSENVQVTPYKSTHNVGGGVFQPMKVCWRAPIQHQNGQLRLEPWIREGQRS